VPRGISADRTSGFRFGTFRERSKAGLNGLDSKRSSCQLDVIPIATVGALKKTQDIRHLSSSQGVAALLQASYKHLQTAQLPNGSCFLVGFSIGLCI